MLPTSSALLLLQDTEAPGQGGPDMFVLLLGVLAIFLFVVILPERKNRKKREAMIEAVKKNDRVLTHSGFFATVAAVNEADITVKFDDGQTRARMLKSSIASVITKDDEAS